MDNCCNLELFSALGDLSVVGGAVPGAGEAVPIDGGAVPVQ